MDQKQQNLELQQKEIDAANQRLYSGYSLSFLFVLLPLIIGFTTYTNKTDGIIYGSIGVISSILLPYIYFELNKKPGAIEVASFSFSSIILLVIITTIIVFNNRH